MASSDNLMTMEPWAFRCTFNDSWFPEMFSKETETLTKVLQNSFSNQQPEITPMGSPVFKLETNTTTSGATVSYGSENETNVAVSKQRSNNNNNNNNNGVSKKITKRKPRASKRASTTYITADVDSFRQMVQQVTGVRMGGIGHVGVTGSVLKPEPRRPIDRVQPINCLPTLDTSAFLLDPTSSYMSPPVSAVQPPSAVVGDGGAGGFGFESYCAFPTLESWERNGMQ